MVTSATIIDNKGVSYVEWGAVIAGSVLACAVSLVLLQFGNALGLSFTHIQRAETITAAKIVTVGLWLLWVQLMASMSGGYLAGRMRAPWSNSNHESELRDGAHGLLVWATSSLVVTVAVAVAAFIAALAAHGLDAANEPHLSDALMRKSGIIIGFSLAASYLVSAVAAWWMGTVGGDHRDNAADASHRVSFRRAALAARSKKK